MKQWKKTKMFHILKMSYNSSFDIANAHNIYNFVYTATGYPAGLISGTTPNKYIARLNQF